MGVSPVNEDNANNPQRADLEKTSLEQTDLERNDLEQAVVQRDWNALLSETARRAPLDSTAVPVALEALGRERQRTADGSPWAQYLSSAAQLHDVDFDAVQPALRALSLERRRVRQWRGSVTRLIASAAAVAAVVAAVAVFSPSRSADPTEAYSAYQEAARGW